VRPRAVGASLDFGMLRHARAWASIPSVASKQTIVSNDAATALDAPGAAVPG
jgi:hypothetical protein